MKKIKSSVVCCLVKGNESHGTVIMQNRKPPKIFISILIDILFVLLIKFSSFFSNGHFLNPRHFQFSPTLYLLLLNLLLSLAGYSLPRHFYPSSFYIKWKLYELPASSNKLNLPKVIPHLGYHNNTSEYDSKSLVIFQG